jgi:hypothetical protein
MLFVQLHKTLNSVGLFLGDQEKKKIILKQERPNFSQMLPEYFCIYLKVMTVHKTQDFLKCSCRKNISKFGKKVKKVLFFVHYVGLSNE